MIETTEAAMTRRAVLIGINYYVKDRCLQGCVRDVTDIKHTLDNDNSPTSASILVLTATTPADQSSVRPLEEPTAWPTYDNVSKALNSIKERSRPGDFVYIHYSGHGTRLPNGQMALVLYNADLNTPYSSFPGRLLGGLLQRLAAKGVFVTLVLDCCFSGGILRSDNLQGAEARSIDYNPLLDAHADQDANKLPMDVEHTFRDSSIHLENWLVNPEGYTILSATSPYDTAWELTLNETGERRGALSYFLIRGLNRVRQRALTPTNGMLYQHLRTLFHAHWPKQCPMRYGNQDIAFFGCPRGPPDTGFVSIFKTGLGQLCLAAGQAHGVQVGDEYAAYPFDFEAPSQLRDSPIMVRVDKVQPMTSILVEINQARADTERPGIESGWKGKLATPLPRYVFSIGILRDIGDSLVRSHIPGQHPYLHLSHPPDRKGRACIFNVTVNERNEYEILDGYHQRLWSLPTIPWNDQHPVETHKTVLDILQHLARFKYLEEIDNRIPDPAFENSFSLITIPTSEPGVSGNFEVNHGDEWGFIIENVGETNLYVALLDFGPSWQIADLFSNAYKSGFIVVPPKSNWDAGREEVRLTMEVPERLRSRGHNQCEDVIKVFVTNIATDFSSLTQPEIPLNAKDLCSFPYAHRDGDRLRDFFQALVLGYRNQGVTASIPSHWAVRNFVIVTAS